MVIHHCFFSKDIHRLEEDLSQLRELEELFVNKFSDKNIYKRIDNSENNNFSKDKKMCDNLEDVVRELRNAGENLPTYRFLDENYNKNVMNLLDEERNWGFNHLSTLGFIFLNNISPDSLFAINKTKDFTRQMLVLNEKSILKELNYRVKESLHKKFLLKIEEKDIVHDTNGIRLLANNINNCYKIANWIDDGGKDSRLFSRKSENIENSNKWIVLDDRSKDYLNKGNQRGYKALYRTIKFPRDLSIEGGGISVEIQILTPEVYEQNELISPHNTYKLEQENELRKYYPEFIINHFHNLLKV
ncbi:hypothetical protein CMO90_04525 [Candidatus Woesearchaeota archaeon]|jgi:hypothetical protein|nr:hypothetical protein [Candidatus Woesearchaeota archaeon]|tara:strand:+ start:1590 stop:2495 length:906 start_codon:yes stop_codon:yes gene_type:complete